MFTYNQVVIIITFFGFLNKPEGEKLAPLFFKR